MAAKKKSATKKAAGKKPVARKKKPAEPQKYGLPPGAPMDVNTGCVGLPLDEQPTKEAVASVGLDTGDGGTQRLKIFKAEAVDGDTIYVEATDMDQAKNKFDAIHGETPETMVTWSEVNALPEGEEFMAEPSTLDRDSGRSELEEKNAVDDELDPEEEDFDDGQG